MQLFATEHPFTTGLDISSSQFWSQTFEARDETFASLRRDAPVSWHPPIDGSAHAAFEHGEQGFWAVTLARDINHASQHHEIFSSGIGGVTVQPSPPALSAGAPTFMTMDPPGHSRYRNIISAAFTPTAVARLHAKIEERAERIVEAVQGAGEFDFVEQVSSQLPMLTVADLVGVPESEVEAFTRAGNQLVTSTDRSAVPEGVSPSDYALEAMTELRRISLDLVRHRCDHPADDIASDLARSGITDDEVASVLLLLSVAGNDTTKHTTSWTVLNLDRNPEQRAWLRADFEGRIAQAVEEFVRHATVVNMFARTATEDTVLGGQEIAAGDKVGLFYCSGNRDETVFPDPHRFDLSRPRTSHVAFGGRGVHFCLGNVVAKAQLRSLFREILRRLPNLQVTGEPTRLAFEGFNAMRHLPVTSG